MGLAGMAMDSAGRLYVSDMNGRILRFDPDTGAQEEYAMFPTDTGFAMTNMPGDIVFDEDGNLYVTETNGAFVIWRVPPGGGMAEQWFVDPTRTGAWADNLGGIRIDGGGKYLYLNATEGPRVVVWRLPIDQPDPSKLEVFHRYDVGLTGRICSPSPSVHLCEGTGGFAGGLAFGMSGKLYVVALAGPFVSVLRRDGTEERRFPSSPEENSRQEVPYDVPIFAAFNGRGSLLVTNTELPTAEDQQAKEWYVLDAYVRDTALPLERPDIPDEIGDMASV
jgi:sugar lactone lactonase YvrE